MKIKRFLLSSLLAISAFALCSCGKGNNSAGRNESTKNEYSDEGTYIYLTSNGSGEERVITFINGDGTFEIKGFDDIKDFYKNAAIAKKDSQIGIIDTAGKELVPFGEYTEIISLNVNHVLFDRYIVKNKDGKCGVIDSTGNIIVPIEYNSMSFDNLNKDITDSNEIRSAVIYYFGKKSDGSKDVYNRFGQKIIEGFSSSDKLTYCVPGNNSDNYGVFCHYKDDKAILISEKTGETILTLDKTDDNEVEIYFTGLISYNNDTDKKYETYVLSEDYTSATKISNGKIYSSAICDKYRFVKYKENADLDYEGKLFVYDDKGELCFTTDCLSYFYPLGHGEKMQLFIQLSSKEYEVYDAQFKDLGKCYMDCESSHLFFVTKVRGTAGTIYDYDGNVLYENAYYGKDGVFGLEDGTGLTYISGTRINYPNSLRSVNSAFPGYALFTDNKDYFIYDKNGEVCNIGAGKPYIYPNVKVLRLGTNYYNYKGELIYPK